MSLVQRSAAGLTPLAGPIAQLASALRRTLVILRFATSSTTAADWRRWIEVHTPRKTQPG